ncbi:MAG: cation transporting ATPase C-terminal domain-containing protein, partial [Acidimicrobiia bacterium]
LLTDGLPALALGFDRPRRELALRPAASKTSQLMSARRLAMLVGRGVVLAAGAIGSLAVSRAAGASWEEARTVMFIALVVAHLLYAFVVRLPADGNFFNARLVVAVGIGLVLQVGTVLGPFNDLFEVVPLSVEQWLLAIGAGTAPVVVLGAIETFRHLLGRHNPASV